MDPGDRFCTRGRVVWVWRFHIPTFPQAESLSRKYRVPQKRCSSSKFQTPAYFSSWREAAVCVSREHSGDVEVEMVLDIDRDELDNEIQDPFFESFRWIFSSQILLGRHLSDDFLEIQVCRIAVYSDHSHDALHEFEAEFPLLNGSCLKGNLLRGSFENTSSPSGHRFPLSLIIAAWISCLVAFACHYEIPGLTTDKSLNISRFPKIATIFQAEKVAGWRFHFENTQTPSDLQIPKLQPWILHLAALVGHYEIPCLRRIWIFQGCKNYPASRRPRKSLDGASNSKKSNAWAVIYLSSPIISRRVASSSHYSLRFTE